MAMVTVPTPSCYRVISRIKQDNATIQQMPDSWKCVSGSVMSDSATPWTVAHQAPLSLKFSRQEYWSGLPFPFQPDS